MTTNENSSALIISTDKQVIEAVVTNDAIDQEFVARESSAEVLTNPALLEQNAIVIYDIDVREGNLDKAINDVIDIKKADPTQVLMLVGGKEKLGEILKSNIQPLVYRAFNKPMNPNQLMLAFKSAHSLHDDLVERRNAGEDILSIGPEENQTTIDSLAADRKTNPAIYAGIGVVALALLAFLFMGGDDETESPQIISQEETTTYDFSEEDFGGTVARTNELNQLASNALLDGRYVSPPGDNALEYYNQVLAIDPYDQIAYDGKKTVAEALRTRYQESVEGANFDAALESLDALKAIEPLNAQNDALSDQLSEALAAHVKQVQETGSKEEIDETTAALERIGNKIQGSQSAAAALQEEAKLIGQIDAALESKNFAPPAKGNAYSLVSNALKSNRISKANAEPRVQTLSTALLGLANSSFDSGDMDNTQKYAALVKRLNVDRDGLGALNAKIKAREAEIAAEQKSKENSDQAAEAQEQAEPEPPKITPAKVISREAPKYPRKALNRDKEGWVKVSFDIDVTGKPTNIQVLEAEPENLFNREAIKSVEKWRFSPARNLDTGLPVVSTDVTTTVQFKLN